MDMDVDQKMDGPMLNSVLLFTGDTDAEFQPSAAPSCLKILEDDVTSRLEQQPLYSTGNKLPANSPFFPPRVSRGSVLLDRKSHYEDVWM